MKKLSSLPRHAPDSKLTHSCVDGQGGTTLWSRIAATARGAPTPSTVPTHCETHIDSYTINSNNNDTVQIDLAEFAKTC
jgi:hypothetical protein